MTNRQQWTNYTPPIPERNATMTKLLQIRVCNPHTGDLAQNYEPFEYEQPSYNHVPVSPTAENRNKRDVHQLYDNDGKYNPIAPEAHGVGLQPCTTVEISAV
eukprot:scaffold27653_cov46-Prasinocladus_malaysianus.AAC.1